MRFSSVVKVLKKDKEIRILILGLDNAGKTTMIQKYLGKEIKDISPTYGYHTIELVKYINNIKYNIYLLDIGGQESVRAYWDTKYTEIDGILFVYDNTSNDSYKNILSQVISHHSLRKAIIICAANKSEENIEESKEIIIKRIKESKGFNWINKSKEIDENNKISIPIIYTSGKTGDNIDYIFNTLINKIIDKSFSP